LTDVVLIADTHFGCRGDIGAFYDYQKKFLDDVFFPYLKNNKIKHVIHLGDLVDNRRTINYVTSHFMRENFLEPLDKLGINVHIIAGNHDCFYKNTNKFNSLKELIGNKYKNIEFYDHAEHIGIDNIQILLLPWISTEFIDETLKMVSNSKAKYCMGHLELKGFEEQKGKLSTHGMDSSIFSNFDVVFSGHYHTRSFSSNIAYIGSTFAFTWSDYNDWRGFAVLTLDTGKVKSIKNPYNMFCKLDYDEDNVPDIDEAKNTYCRINVVNKTSETKFQNFIDKIHEQGVVDLLIDEKSEKIEIQESVNVENTLDIFKKVILEIDEGDKDMLISMIENLHKEAMEAA
jgi:DNA repair exonuclease SbcCD nuclease subunit